MNKIDEDVSLKLRTMLAQGCGIGDMIEVIQQCHGVNPESPLIPLLYFTKVLGVSLSDCLLIAQGNRFNGGRFSDDELDEKLLPIFRKAAGGTGR